MVKRQFDDCPTVARHYNLLLITNHSRILTIHKDIIVNKNVFDNKEIVSKQVVVEKILTVAYNDTQPKNFRKVFLFYLLETFLNRWYSNSYIRIA